jgi:hypothetical protein
MPTRDAAIGNLVADINNFIKSLGKVISLQVSTQQKREALNQSRQNVSKADEALAKAIRNSRDERTVLDREFLLSLFDACQEARDQLGPLEDDFQSADFQLVPREVALVDRGEEIKEKYEALPIPIADQSISPGDSSVKTFRISHKTRSTPLARQQSLDGPAAETTQHTPTPQRDDARKPASRLLFEFGRLTSETDGGETSKARRGDSSFEPLIHAIAPDLISELPWSQFTQYARIQDNEELSPYVMKEDLPNLETITTDIIEEDDDVSLGNTVALRCPFLKERYAAGSAHGRVNLWLLYGLQTSRLEMRKFHELAPVEAKGGLKWSNIRKFWDMDEAAVATSPPGSWLYIGSDSEHAKESVDESTLLDPEELFSSNFLPEGGDLSVKTLIWYSTEQAFLQNLGLSAIETDYEHVGTPTSLSDA